MKKTVSLFLITLSCALPLHPWTTPLQNNGFIGNWVQAEKDKKINDNFIKQQNSILYIIDGINNKKQFNTSALNTLYSFLNDFFEQYNTLNETNKKSFIDTRNISKNIISNYGRPGASLFGIGQPIPLNPDIWYVENPSQCDKDFAEKYGAIQNSFKSTNNFNELQNQVINFSNTFKDSKFLNKDNKETLSTLIKQVDEYIKINDNFIKQRDNIRSIIDGINNKKQFNTSSSNTLYSFLNDFFKQYNTLNETNKKSFVDTRNISKNIIIISNVGIKQPEPITLNSDIWYVENPSQCDKDFAGKYGEIQNSLKSTNNFNELKNQVINFSNTFKDSKFLNKNNKKTLSTLIKEVDEYINTAFTTEYNNITKNLSNPMTTEQAGQIIKLNNRYTDSLNDTNKNTMLNILKSANTAIQQRFQDEIRKIIPSFSYEKSTKEYTINYDQALKIKELNNKWKQQPLDTQYLNKLLNLAEKARQVIYDTYLNEYNNFTTTLSNPMTTEQAGQIIELNNKLQNFPPQKTFDNHLPDENKQRRITLVDEAKVIIINSFEEKFTKLENALKEPLNLENCINAIKTNCAYYDKYKNLMKDKDKQRFFNILSELCNKYPNVYDQLDKNSKDISNLANLVKTAQLAIDTQKNQQTALQPDQTTINDTAKGQNMPIVDTNNPKEGASANSGTGLQPQKVSATFNASTPGN